MILKEMPRVTAEDYQYMPETGPNYQLIDGLLYMAPAPNRFHQDICLNLAVVLRNWLTTHPVGKVYVAPFDVYLGEFDVFQPDILFVSNQRRSILSDRGAEGAPDLVIEILSPRNAKIDLFNKRKMYAVSGVLEEWIIEPETKRISVYRFADRSDEPSAVYEHGETIETALFPDLQIDTREVFTQ